MRMLVYPFDYRFAPYVYFEKSWDIEFILTSPCEWGYYNRLLLDIDGINTSSDKQIYEYCDELIDSADYILILDPVMKVGLEKDIASIINRCNDKGKAVFSNYLKGKEKWVIDNGVNLDDKLVLQWDGISSMPYTQSALQRPILSINIGGDNSRTHIELSILQNMIENNITPVYIPNYPIYIPNLPFGIFNMDWQKIDNLSYTDAISIIGKSISYINRAHTYDTCLISIPGSAMSIANINHNDIFHFILMHHINPIAVICNVPYRIYNDSAFKMISNYLSKVFAYEKIIYIITNVPPDPDELNGNISYRLPRFLREQECVNSVNCEKAFSIWDELHYKSVSKEMLRLFEAIT